MLSWEGLGTRERSARECLGWAKDGQGRPKVRPVGDARAEQVGVEGGAAQTLCTTTEALQGHRAMRRAPSRVASVAHAKDCA